MSIELKNVSYAYKDGSKNAKEALHGINVTIQSGEMIGLVGHTGSGKSTMIQVMDGLIKPDSGQVLLDGKDIFDKEYNKKILRGKVGLAFQYPEHQLFEASVIEDVQFGPKNLGWEPLKVELNSFQALKDVGIGEDLLDVSPLTLSGGQKRRVALAGVLAMEPDYLILDEPMAGLDPKGREEIFQLLLKIRKERNLSIIFVSHSMEDVAAYAERVLVMNRGEIVLDGSPEKIFYYEKELSQIGLAVPASVRLVHKLREKGFHIAEECLTPERAVACMAKLYQDVR